MKYALAAQSYWLVWLAFAGFGHQDLGILAGGLVVLITWCSIWWLELRQDF